MEQGPKFQGSLEKQGRMKTWSWRKYWFVLKDGQLTYVKKQDKMASQGHIDVSQAHTVRLVAGNRGFPFEIVTKSRTHYLSASSADIRDKWLKLLHESMSWSARNPLRTGSINSTRASCNSIMDEDEEEYGYSTVEASVRASGTPSASSGYSSTSSNRASESRASDERNSIRDSGTEDLMYLNKNYSNFKGEEVPESGSNADSFARNSGKSITSASSDVSEATLLYEDIDKRNNQLHQGLRRLHERKSIPESSDLPDSLTDARDSTVSDIYAEVDEPMANIAISHIVKGYANIARNKGPQQTPDKDMPSESTSDHEDLYDEVFDSLNAPRQSKVVMRRSQRSSEIENDYAQTADSLLVGRTSRNDSGSTSSVSTRTSNRSSQQMEKPKPAPKPPGTVSIRRSMLPDDVQAYFNLSPIPDLPHPRIELTDRSTFDDIRKFLASHRGPDEVYIASKNNDSKGEAINNLQTYLKVLG